MSKKYFQILAFLIIFLFTLIAYLPGFSAPFVFDDIRRIQFSDLIRGGKPISDFWLSQPSRVLPNLTLALNYSWGGTRVMGYHVINFLFHLGTAYLVYALVFLLSENSKKLALICALLFAVHPIQTESVTYIIQRSTVMSAFFYLICVICMTFCFRRSLSSRVNSDGHREKSRLACASRNLPKTMYLLALVSALCAFFSKENAFTLPFALLLTGGIFFQKIPPHKIARLLAPFFLLAFLVFMLERYPRTFFGNWVQDFSQIPVATRLTQIRPRDYFFTQLNAVGSYISLLILPFGQNIDHDYPVTSNPFTIPTLISVMIHMILLSVAFRRRKKRPFFSFGIFFFYLTLAVESSFIPLDDVFVEHRLYLPSLGLLLAGVSLIDSLTRQKIIYVFFTILILFFTYLTYQRNLVWRSEISLWQDALAKSPQKPRPYVNLGAVLVEQDRNEEGITMLKKAISLYQDKAAFYRKRGDTVRVQESETEAFYYEDIIQMIRDYMDRITPR